MDLFDYFEQKNSKLYICEIGAGCPIAQSIYKRPGASRVVYHSESPYGSAKDLYKGIIGDDRMVSHQTVLLLAHHFADLSDSKYDTVLVTSFQIRSGSEDTRNPHGWVCLGEKDVGGWKYTLMHFTFLSELGYRYDREESIDAIPLEIYETLQGTPKCLDQFFNCFRNNYHVLKSEQPIFFKNREQFRIEDEARKYKRLAIYKGSFNPMHFGHKAIVDKVSEDPDVLPILVISKNTYEKGDIDYSSLITRIEALNDAGYIVCIMSNGYFFDCYSYFRERLSMTVELVMGVDTYNRIIECYRKQDFSKNERIESSIWIRSKDGIYDESGLIKPEILEYTLNNNFDDAIFRVFGRGVEISTVIKPKNLIYDDSFACDVSSSEIRKLMESGNTDKAVTLMNGEK